MARATAYLVGVEYSLRNIPAQIRPLISKYGPQDRVLVCCRGGKRSRLWAESLRTIGLEVDVLAEAGNATKAGSALV